MSDRNKPRDPQNPGDASPETPEPETPVGVDDVTPKVITDTLVHGSDEVSLSAAKTIAEAAEQVVVRLGIEKFIEAQWEEKIDPKLRECERYAIASAAFGGDMIFISMAIPLVNGIIHVGSDREKLAKTSDWISRVWEKASLTPDAERIPTISALTLIYLITIGWRSARKLKTKDESHQLWKRMQQRVQRLCSDKASRGATADPSGPKGAK
jgi:hypothetical protein